MLAMNGEDPWPRELPATNGGDLWPRELLDFRCGRKGQETDGGQIELGRVNLRVRRLNYPCPL